MSDTRLMMAQSEIASDQKSAGIAWLLWWFTGIIGGHRFYLGDWGIGLIMLFTLGLFGVGTLVDAFLISGRVRAVNAQRRTEIYQHHGVYA